MVEIGALYVCWSITFRRKRFRLLDRRLKKAWKTKVKEILFPVGSHVVSEAKSSKASEFYLNSHEFRNRCFIVDSLYCMYLIDRFSQLLIVPLKGFRNPLSETWVNFVSGIRNPWLWNPEYSWRNPESYYGLEFRIQGSLKKDWNQESTAWNPESKTSWIPLHEAWDINDLTSTIHHAFVTDALPVALYVLSHTLLTGLHFQ